MLLMHRFNRSLPLAVALPKNTVISKNYSVLLTENGTSLFPVRQEPPWPVNGGRKG